MKALVLLVVLASSVTRYDAHGVAKLYTGLPSCGALERLAHDRWHIELHEGEGYASVNGTRWGIATGYADLTLTYFADPLAYMSMHMTIRGLFGELRMDGITAARVACADRVLLRVR